MTTVNLHSSRVARIRAESPGDEGREHARHAARGVQTRISDKPFARADFRLQSNCHPWTLRSAKRAKWHAARFVQGQGNVAGNLGTLRKRF